MYIRARTVKNRLGSFEGTLGQGAPVQQTHTDPVDGSSVVFVGFAHELAIVPNVISLVRAAVTSSDKDAAKKLLANAKGMAPAAGQSAPKLLAIISKAETKVSGPGVTAGDVSDVLKGVGSILSSIAPAATQVYAAHTQAQLDKAALKRMQQQNPGMSQDQLMALMLSQQQPQKSNTGLIIGIVGGVMLLGLLVIVMSKKK